VRQPESLPKDKSLSTVFYYDLFST